jgi:hypothetical protein
MPRLRRPRVDASPSHRSTHFAFRLAAHCLRERRDVGLRYAGVGGCAVFGGRAPFDAVDRTALFVRPIDCRPLGRACAAQSARRVSCAEANPSQRSTRRCSRRDPAEAVRRPAPASSRLAQRTSAGAQSRFLPPMKDQEPSALLTASAPRDVRSQVTSSSTSSGSELSSIAIVFAPAAVSLSVVSCDFLS